MKGKKGNLSLEVVIIATLALLVLVVLTVIFAGRMGMWNSGMKHCDTICKATSDECNDEGYDIPLYWNSCQDDLGSKFDGHAYCCRVKES